MERQMMLNSVLQRSQPSVYEDECERNKYLRNKLSKMKMEKQRLTESFL